MSKAVKGFTFLGKDGNHFSISQAPDEGEFVLCIQQNDEKGRLATARIDKEQLDELMSLKYELVKEF